MKTQQQWGLTAPISVAHPEPHELAQNEALLAELKANNCFEKQEETDHRVAVLAHFQTVLEEFVRQVGKDKKAQGDESVIENAGGKIFTFGGYRLGVYGPGSDIDALVITPKHVTRTEFFDQFPILLKKMSPEGAINSITPVPDAYVPIMKVIYEGVDLDLPFVSLQVNTIPRDLNLRDPAFVKELDDSELRGINAPTVAEEILSLVPQTKTFRFALRTVKLWANKRGVYGNVVGFPGGIAWALMVARICQLYPYACGATIVLKFFRLMSEWSWHRPVLLKELVVDPNRPSVRMWNPELRAADAHHLMPVITPTFPSMCTTHNVSHSTLEIVQRELTLARTITEKIFRGDAAWKDLLTKYPFFTSGYKYYLSVIATSKDKALQKAWAGLVQSKVRHLVSGIPQSDAGVRLAHPYTEGFRRFHRCPKSKFNDVCQGDLSYQVPAEEVPDEKESSSETPKTPEEDDPMITVHTTTFYVGLELMEFHKSLDISYPVSEFTRYCLSAPGFAYDPEQHFLRIIHTRNYALPDDVFEPGEVKPTRTKKARGPRTTNNTSKKRSFANASIDDPDHTGGKRHRNVKGDSEVPA